MRSRSYSGNNLLPKAGTNFVSEHIRAYLSITHLRRLEFFLKVNKNDTELIADLKRDIRRLCEHEHHFTKLALFPFLLFSSRSPNKVHFHMMGHILIIPDFTNGQKFRPFYK